MLPNQHTGALTPLFKGNLVSTDGIIVNSFSGVSGAGKKLSADYLYCERDGSAVAYGLPLHKTSFRDRRAAFQSRWATSGSTVVLT